MEIVLFLYYGRLGQFTICLNFDLFKFQGKLLHDCLKLLQSFRCFTFGQLLNFVNKTFGTETTHRNKYFASSYENTKEDYLYLKLFIVE